MNKSSKSLLNHSLTKSCPCSMKIVVLFLRLYICIILIIGFCSLFPLLERVAIYPMELIGNVQ